MVNKRIIVAGLIIAFMIILAVAVSIRSPTEASEISTPNAKEPPVIQSMQESTALRELELSDESVDNVICEKPPSGNIYGGISGSENSPPNGTVVDQGLTTYYGKPTAAGTCGTYWYIAGWWFNTSEMAKLPSETISYGVSPYAITEGSSTGGGNNEGDTPITPVPEIASIILVITGIVILVVWKKMKK